MTEDILRFYPLNTKNFSTGLFKKSINNRALSDRPKKSIYGVSYTRYAEAFEMKIFEDISLFELFHKNCDDFAMTFYKKHPDWEIYELRRDTFYNSLVHVFAIKKLKDGRILFADARGITDNVIEFFDDFTFSKSVYIKKTDIERDIPLEGICNEGYKIIFKEEDFKNLD